MDKQWYIETMKYYYSALKKKLSHHENAWRNLKSVLLSSISQCEKVTYTYYVSPIKHSGKGKL